MTQAARDERERGLTPEANPTDATDLTYYTREQVGPGPEDVRWTPIVDPAEVAAIQGSLAQGIDPPYEVWADAAPAALAPADLAPADDTPTVYAWEQTGPAVGEGQLYEVSDPVVVAAYTEGHPEPSGIEIANPAAYYEAAAVPSQAQEIAPEPFLYGAQIDALAYVGATWLAVEETGDGVALGRYTAPSLKGDPIGWEPLRVGDGPDDGPAGNAYPDAAAAYQSAIASNGAALAAPPLDLIPAPVALDRDPTPGLNLDAIF